MKKRILCVDDNPAVLKVIQSALNRPEFEVVAMTDPVRALSIAKKEKPDLIILDVMMPGMDGYAVCRELKETPSTQNVPVIFLTAKAEVKDMLKGYFQGAHLYMAKPFGVKKLLNSVAKLLETEEQLP